MIIPGIVSVTFRAKTAEDIIRLCKNAGLQAVEWSENVHVASNDSEGAEELYKKTTAAGLKIAAYGSYYRLGENEDPESRFAESLISAAALHAPLIRIWAGSEASDAVDAEGREQLAEEARRICDMAAEKGIKVALEWHKNTLTDTNESAFRFLDEVGHPNLYCLWQPTVALTMQQRVDGLKCLGDRLLNLHAYYWDHGVRRPFGEGLSEWEQYLGGVDMQEERFILMEFVMDNTEGQFMEDAKALHQLLERYR